jgi:hypothetical protein
MKLGRIGKGVKTKSTNILSDFWRLLLSNGRILTTHKRERERERKVRDRERE